MSYGVLDNLRYVWGVLGGAYVIQMRNWESLLWRMAFYRNLYAVLRTLWDVLLPQDILYAASLPAPAPADASCISHVSGAALYGTTFWCVVSAFTTCCPGASHALDNMKLFFFQGALTKHTF